MLREANTALATCALRFDADFLKVLASVILIWTFFFDRPFCSVLCWLAITDHEARIEGMRCAIIKIRCLEQINH